MFYNQLVEKTAVEIFLFILLEIIILAIFIRFLGFKFLKQNIIYILILSFFISLSSSIFVTNNYGGVYFWERSGYPYQFTITGNELVTNLSIDTSLEPKILDFDSFRFFINYTFWTLVVTIIFASINLINKNNKMPK